MPILISLIFPISHCSFHSTKSVQQNEFLCIKNPSLPPFSKGRDSPLWQRGVRGDFLFVRRSKFKHRLSLKSTELTLPIVPFRQGRGRITSPTSPYIRGGQVGVM